ncbi:MAG: RecX family transcriptional regulator, partial [Calditrichaeota bacterium]
HKANSNSYYFSVPPEAIEAVVARLQQNNYLNDAEFGRAWVASRSRQNPKGRQALRYELQQKGLSRNDIEQALQDLDEEQLAWQAAQKQLSRWKKLDEPTFRRKLHAYLARRGFAYDIIQTTVYRAWNSNTDSNERNN